METLLVFEIKREKQWIPVQEDKEAAASIEHAVGMPSRLFFVFDPWLGTITEAAQWAKFISYCFKQGQMAKGNEARQGTPPPTHSMFLASWTTLEPE